MDCKSDSKGNQTHDGAEGWKVPIHSFWEHSSFVENFVNVLVELMF